MKPERTKLPYLAVARFSGEEACAFLQSQLSADIAALEPGMATFACYCTPKGQVLGLLRVQRTAQEYRVAGARGLLPGMLQRLKMFVFRTRVHFEAAEDLCVYGLGPGEYLFEECAEDGAADVSAWKAAELQAGVAWLGAGSSEKFIPQMLGFDTIGAVSYSKGCYPGQEIVARAKYLGKVKRKPVHARVAGMPLPEAGARLSVLRGGEWSDAVTVDAVQADDIGVQLMAVAPSEPAAPVTEIEYGGKSYRCATM